MLSKLIVSTDLELQKEAALKEISKSEISLNHPDLLWVEPQEGKKLGVEESKKIREHFALKPYSAKGRVAVVISSDTLTLDAQNSLLKTLEEPPESGSFILTANSEDSLLPTILSRCQVVFLDDKNSKDKNLKAKEEIEKLFGASLEERFQIIEKYENKDELLNALAEYISEKLYQNLNLADFASKVVEAQEWNKAQGNTRAILEYLMLNLG